MIKVIDLRSKSTQGIGGLKVGDSFLTSNAELGTIVSPEKGLLAYPYRSVFFHEDATTRLVGPETKVTPVDIEVHIVK